MYLHTNYIKFYIVYLLQYVYCVKNISNLSIINEKDKPSNSITQKSKQYGHYETLNNPCSYIANEAELDGINNKEELANPIDSIIYTVNEINKEELTNLIDSTVETDSPAFKKKSNILNKSKSKDDVLLHNGEIFKISDNDENQPPNSNSILSLSSRSTSLSIESNSNSEENKLNNIDNQNIIKCDKLKGMSMVIFLIGVLICSLLSLILIKHPYTKTIFL